MSKYVDLVLADATITPNGFKQNPYIFGAPFNSYLKEGDTVIVEADTGVFTYTVRSVITCAQDSDEYAFVRAMYGKDFLCITSKAVKFYYDEGDSDV